MTHASDPVPYMIYRKTSEKDSGIESFTENTAKISGKYVEIGNTLINHFIND